MRRFVWVSLLVLAVGIVPLEGAGAVTYGDPVVDAGQFPEVVEIASYDGSTGEYYSTCTGTLISQTEVLTAAHCVRNKEHLLVNVGALSVDDWNPVGVVASWYSGRYSEARFANDIGLLRLVRDAGVPRVAKLARSFTPGRSTRYVLAGYGYDQNGDSRGLMSAVLVPQDKAAGRYFGRSFNAKTTLGAGKFISSEGVYSGACNGDSGGPLFVRSDSRPRTVVGIVSYGASDCDERAPTVFSRVSYYLPTISSGRKFLSARAAEPLAPLVLTTEKVPGSNRPQLKLTATTAAGRFIRSFCLKIDGVPVTSSDAAGDFGLIPYRPEDGCFYNNDEYSLSGGTVTLGSSSAARVVEVTVMDELRRTTVATVSLP